MEGSTSSSKTIKVNWEYLQLRATYGLKQRKFVFVFCLVPSNDLYFFQHLRGYIIIFNTYLFSIHIYIAYLQSFIL